MRILVLSIPVLTILVFDHSMVKAQSAPTDPPAQAANAPTAEGPGVEFPPTTGPYPIGRASYHLVDASRKEVFTAEPDDVRELMVTVHYPAEVAEGQSAAPYAEDELAAAIGKAYSKSLAFFRLMHSHAVTKVPCIAKKDGFPVVIFSPGFKAHPLFYTAILEDLASQGFVVVSVCHPYSTGVTVFPDGRAVRTNDEGTRFELDKKDRSVPPETIGEHRDAIGEVWIADVRFVLDSLERLNKSDAWLADRLDLSHVGVFGHSFGGATAAAAVQRDKRFRAGINLDGSDFGSTQGEPLRDSFLWVCSEPPDFAKMPVPRVRKADGKTAEEPSKGPQPVQGAEGKFAAGSRVILKRPGDPTLPPLDPTKGRPNDGLRAPPGCRITLKGSKHQTFMSDMALLKATPGMSHFAMGEDAGSIDGRRAVFVVNALVAGFFRRHLRDESVAFLDDPSTEFPEAVRDKQRH